MFAVTGQLLRTMRHVEVADPGEMAGDSRISQRLRQGETSNTYRLSDRSLWRSRPGPLLTRLSGRSLGDDLHLAINADRHAVAVEVHDPGLTRTCLSASIAGSASVARDGSAVTASGTRGAVFHGQAGLRLDSSDRSVRVNLWVSDSLMTRVLNGLLPERPAAPLRFRPDFDWSQGGGQALHRLVSHLLAELPDPDGLAASRTALASYAELLAETMLRRLPHNHAEAMRNPRDAAVPGHLRRAEAFMEANAHGPLTMLSVAEAASCSLRALHEAFRRFRDTTPHAALLAIRLQRAHTLLRIERDAPAGLIARRIGFTNATRFAVAYQARFGETPAETQRRGTMVSLRVAPPREPVPALREPAPAEELG